MCPDVWLYIIYYILNYVWIYIIYFDIILYSILYIVLCLDIYYQVWIWPQSRRSKCHFWTEKLRSVISFILFFMAILKNTINDGGVAPQHSLAHIKQPQKTHIEHMDPCRTQKFGQTCEIQSKSYHPRQRCKKLQMLQIYLCYFFQMVLIFGPFWQFWVISGLFWVILGHFWTIFWC